MTPEEEMVVWYCRNTRGWLPTAKKYSMSVYEVKALMKKNALNEKERSTNP